MATYKQDMAPPGGYAPINYKRIPLRKGIGGKAALSLAFGISAYGWFQFFRHRDRSNIETIEMRCATQAIRPLLEAENDRAVLKQLKRNRDAEEKIMKDVKGWEVGKWENKPVYLSLGPDEYFPISKMEYLAHTDTKPFVEAKFILKDN